MQVEHLLGGPDIDQIYADLHLLMSIVLASKPIAEAARDRMKLIEDVVDMSEKESRAISRLLFSLAANLRILDDKNDRLFDALGQGVGTLIEPLMRIPDPGEKGKAATMRDACNKIIHADSLEMPRTVLLSDPRTMEPYCSYVSPQLSIYGESRTGRRGVAKKWFLVIDIVSFVHEAMYGLMEVQNPHLRPQDAEENE